MNGTAPPQTVIESLASGGLGGHPHAVWNLIEASWPMLQRFVLRRLCHGGIRRNMLEDCGQIIMERVWRFRKTYKGSSEGEFWNWLKRICDNERIRLEMKEEKQPVRQADLSGASSAGGTKDSENETLERIVTTHVDPIIDDVEMQESLSALRECLDGLEERHLKVIELLFFRAELTERAAAEVMDCSAAYVHKLKVQGIEDLRQCLESKGID